jgi:hypothetical protein
MRPNILFFLALKSIIMTSESEGKFCKS